MKKKVKGSRGKNRGIEKKGKKGRKGGSKINR